MAASKQDAYQNGWSTAFETAVSNQSILGSLMGQFKVECPSRGRGVKRAAFDYKRFFELMPSSTCPNATGMPPNFLNSSTHASPDFDLFEYVEFITQLTKAGGFYDSMEAAKHWQKTHIQKTMAMSFPGALAKYISGALINGGCKEQSLDFAMKSGRDCEFKDSTNFAGHGTLTLCDSLPAHFNQKVARLSAGPRSGAPGASRLRRVFVHCSVIVNSDAFRHGEDIMVAIEMLHNELVKSCTEYSNRGSITLFLHVFLLRQKLLT
jgi:hypothetical protein